MKENDKFAFPVPSNIIKKTIDEDGTESTIFRNGYNGMTLREYYAGQALAGIMANIHNIDQTDYVGVVGSHIVAKMAIDIADALIAELEGGEHE